MTRPSAALADLFGGHLRAHERRLRTFSEQDWRHYADLLAGAFLLAVRRRFTPGQDGGSIIRFVASVRERYDANGHDVAPDLAEALVRSALGGEPVPGSAAAVTARTLLTLGLLADEGMTDRELGDFLAAVADAARQPRGDLIRQAGATPPAGAGPTPATPPADAAGSLAADGPPPAGDAPEPG